MPADAVSSGFDCISRRFPAGLLAVNQGESTQKCSQRRRKCASGILETHSNAGAVRRTIPASGAPSAWKAALRAFSGSMGPVRARWAPVHRLCVWRARETVARRSCDGWGPFHPDTRASSPLRVYGIHRTYVLLHPHGCPFPAPCPLSLNYDKIWASSVYGCTKMKECI